MADYSEVAAAFAAGMAASQREQATAYEPMGSATPLVSDGQPDQQPYSPPEPGPGGVT